jgi:predicted DNA-binding transcriptional regulator YafY
VRADRLVALLLLLQSRRRVTVPEVARELEISERTARRDLEALGMAGLPVYSQRGRNGGWQLLGGARTDLSGLTSAEARALFLVAGPASTATPEVKAALRKLVRALPETFRTAAEAAAGAIVADPVSWRRGEPSTARPPPEHLDALQSAVIDGQQVQLSYVARDRAATTRVVHPLGLATKAGTWYLVAGTEAGMRTFRVDRVTAIHATGAAVVRPVDFDLAAAWRLVTERIDEHFSRVVVVALVAPWVVGALRNLAGSRLRIGPAGLDGRVEIEIGGPTARSLAAELCGFGAAVEVVAPDDVRARLAELGRELSDRYA